jgi:hypothetical protein
VVTDAAVRRLDATIAIGRFARARIPVRCVARAMPASLARAVAGVVECVDSGRGF